MCESKEIFIDRIEQSHIQYSEMENLINLCNEGKAFSGLTKDEEENLIEQLKNDDLKYSNDMCIDMILEYVCKSTKDNKLRDTIKNVKIGSIDSNIVGRSYPQYSDGTYYIEVSQEVHKNFCFLADVVATIFMLDEKTSDIERQILMELLELNIQRYENKSDFVAGYNEIQLKMMRCDNELNPNFSNKYISYSREMIETALACFVGHEVGHHYLGHTISNDLKEQPEENMFLKEYKADIFGILFALSYLESAYPNEENRYGIHQFLGIYIPFLITIHISKDKEIETGNHPLAYDRYNVAHNYIKSKLTDDTINTLLIYLEKLFYRIDFT